MAIVFTSCEIHTDWLLRMAPAKATKAMLRKEKLRKKHRDERRRRQVSQSKVGA